MTYKSFEELPVWQTAIRFAVSASLFAKSPEFSGEGDARDQLQRASLSISNNIAEGYERGSTDALLNFLYIARGSAGESRSTLRFCEIHPRFAHHKGEVEKLIQEVLEISRQLGGWTQSLQNSDIQGQRHLNEETRRSYDQERRTNSFLEKLKEIQEKHPPKSEM